ncbi:MAG: Xaa-Pro aminopeptidase [Acidobacteriota bacterium]|nr:Xaa-Pro aminopeptidase [Acidobacteriota bacterium]
MTTLVSRGRLQITVTTLLVIVGALTLTTAQASNACAVDDRPARALHVTPAEPVWDDAARLSELAARREKVAEYIGEKSVLVLFSGEPRVYAGDVDYEFRQENNLFYLTHLNQQGATLVLLPGATQFREILFLPRRVASQEVWTGHMYSAEEAYKLSGIAEIWDAAEFEPFVRALRLRRLYRPKDESILRSSAPSTIVTLTTQPTSTTSGQTTTPITAQITSTAQSTSVTQSSSQPSQTQAGGDALTSAMMQGEASIYLLLPGEAESREYRQEQNFAAQWARSDRGLTVRNILPLFAQMRRVKSPAEQLLAQHAVDITVEALERAMSVASQSRWEYEVEAEVDYTFKRRHADNWGYPSIVGCGADATTLHYEESQGRVKAGDLLLMDVGAEYAHMSADVTRTFPVSGKFSPAQADIYNAVYAASEAAMRVAKPGATISEVHNAALASIKDSLLRLGLITDRNSTQYRLWFMHGTSHWLGMNVHDLDVFARGARKFEPGMIFTIEPGIYIRADALDNLPKTTENQKFIDAVRPAFEKYKNIGVRIEDDVLITSDGNRVMTAALPRSLQEVESTMAKLTR